eukprot:jgi/Chrzof1/13496/Cz08g00010.t1
MPQPSQCGHTQPIHLINSTRHHKDRVSAKYELSEHSELSGWLQLMTRVMFYILQPKSEWQPPKGVPAAYNLTSPIICHNPPSKCGHTQPSHLSNSTWLSIHPAPKYELSELSELSGWSALDSTLKQQHSNQPCMLVSWVKVLGIRYRV